MHRSVINTVLREPRHYGGAGDVVSEYKTYSESQVKVYKDDKLISTTHTAVKTSQLIKIMFTELYSIDVMLYIAEDQ